MTASNWAQQMTNCGVINMCIFCMKACEIEQREIIQQKRMKKMRQISTIFNRYVYCGSVGVKSITQHVLHFIECAIQIDVCEINIIIIVVVVVVCLYHLRTLRMLHIFTHAVKRPRKKTRALTHTSSSNPMIRCKQFNLLKCNDT